MFRTSALALFVGRALDDPTSEEIEKFVVQWSAEPRHPYTLATDFRVEVRAVELAHHVAFIWTVGTHQDPRRRVEWGGSLLYTSPSPRD